VYRRTLEIQSIDIAPDAGSFTHYTMLGVVFLHLVFMTDRGPGFALVWQKGPPRTLMNGGTRYIRLSVVASLIPTH